MTQHLSTLKLHQYRYGELEGDICEAARAHIETCERCSQRLLVQERGREEFVLQPLPAAIAATAKPANNARWFARFVPVLVAAAAILFVSLTFLNDDDGNRAKGVLPEIEVWVGTDAGPRALRSEERLRAGDSIQLLYDPHGYSMITLVGRDGTGQIEVYKTLHPEGEGLRPAPFALTLDDASGPQEFWIIASDAPIAMDEIADAIDGKLNEVHVRGVIVPKE
jgi:hypothetical protein